MNFYDKGIYIISILGETIILKCCGKYCKWWYDYGSVSFHIKISDYMYWKGGSENQKGTRMLVLMPFGLKF